MKIDFSKQMTNLGGEPMQEALGPDKPTTPLTLKTLAVNALLANEKDLSGEDKFSRYTLALKINQAEGEADVSVEEIALIKKLIGENYIPLLVGQAWSILDPKG